ncbi:helix-turn-helix transcriptional regulator [Streptomyces sp. B1866]|uniref:helix-turn-helix domain-containing protein n=1 Tax=Streptomyces sp. B1866 TaxID=3075431 RepID=UPI00288DD61F|nr:helix-turn-helix transcriptional regulator [Streptomyces sp. B1866]MDT3398302.1 helix-turn-helix transcriptional regulator [Streptomyces sp. B1866]
MAEREKDERLTLPEVLGNELKRRRDRSGLSLRDLGDKTRFDHSYIGKVERGVQAPSENLAHALDDLLDTGGTFFELLEVITGGTIQEYQRKGAEWELRAERIRVFASSTIPVLLQTEDYARSRISSEKPKAPKSDIDDAVAIRLARQRVFDREDRPPYWAAMDEAALRRPIRDRKAMADQLAHILRVAENPDVTLQVVPFDRGDYWMLGGSLTLLTTLRGTTIAYVESFGSGELVESTRRVVELAQQFDWTSCLALPERESLDLIGQYLEEYR